MLHSSFVQTYLVKYFTDKIERTTGVKIEIGGVDFRPMKSLVLNDMLLRDYRNDTLFYCQDFSVKIDSFRFATRSFSVRDITLDHAYFNLWITRGAEGGVMNLDVFLEALEGKKKGEAPPKESGKDWLIGLGKVRIRNSRFVYKEKEYEEVDYGINWTDVECRRVNADISGIDFSGGRMKIRVSDLSMVEKTGFVIRELDAEVEASDSTVLLTGGKVVTEKSRLDLRRLEFRWVPGRHDWRNFTTRMQQYYELGPSPVSFEDLAYFNGVLRGIDNTVTASGIVSNTVNRIEGRELKIEIGAKSLLQGHFRSHGLPNVRKTVFDIEFQNSYFNPDDLETIYLPWFERKIKVPAPLHHWEKIDLNGHFKGTIEDFVLAVSSSTRGLKGEASLAYAPCEEDPETCSSLSGDFHFPGVNFGRLSGTGIPAYGYMSGKYSGQLDEDHVRMHLTGKVHSLQMKKGRVKDIDVFLTMEDNDMNMVATVDNDSVKAGVALSIDERDSVSFFTAKGYAGIDCLEDFGLSLVGGREGVKTNFEVVFAQKDPRNHFGNFSLSDLVYSGPQGRFRIDSVNLENRLTDGFYITSLLSDAVDLQIEGHYTEVRPLAFTQELIRSYLPAYSLKGKKPRSNFNMKEADFRYSIRIKEVEPLLQALYPDVKIAPGTQVYSDFRPEEKFFHLTLLSDSIQYKDTRLFRSKVELRGDAERLNVLYTADRIDYNRIGCLYNVRNDLILKDNKVEEKLVWSNWDARTYSGELAASLQFFPSEKQDFRAEMVIHPGVVVMADSVWKVGESKVRLEGKKIGIENFRIHCRNQFLAADGCISESPEDTLSLRVNDLNMADFSRIVLEDRLGILGITSGKVVIKDYYKDNLLYSDLRIRNWGIEGDTLGNLHLMSYWDSDSNRVLIQAENRVGQETPLTIQGSYQPVSDSLQVDIRLSKVGLDRLEKYAGEYFAESRGGLSGRVRLSGSSSRPDISGFLKLDSVQVRVKDLNTSFWIHDSIFVDRSNFLLKELRIRDQEKGTSVCSGYYRFWENQYNLNVASDHFLLLNNGPDQNESFYGRVYISGLTNLNNNNGFTNMTVNARTESNSHLYIPLTSGLTEQNGNFLHFINADQPVRRKGSFRTGKNNFLLNANLELNDNLEVQIVLDPMIGDVLKARGAGDIKVTLDHDGTVNMFGEYKISKGDYLFTLSNLLNKKFILTPGGTIVWNGSPYDATMNINAVYNLKTSLYELLSASNSSDRTTKVPVECILNLSDNFTNPLVKFDINFPTLDAQTKSLVQSLFSSQDEINKQMFSLLILNKFYTPDYMDRTDMEERNAGYQAGVTTVTELVSNQLSRWFSKFSNNFDIGFSYRPGDNITTNEIEVALSTQLLNDRVTISANGNMDVGGTKNIPSNSAGGSNIAGDFDVEVKINKQGTLKLKAYSHTDEKIIYSSKETVQGVGVSYQEAFDTFRELLHKYLSFFKRDKQKNK